MIVRGSGFTFSEGGDGVFFVHRSGRRIRTDALGRAVWNSLPGEREDVLARIRGEAAVSDVMARDFLDVMTAAGIVEPARKANTAEASGLRTGPGAEGAPVSAVVVTHRGADHIRACLSSLTNQTCRPLEIVVVDNASRDGTADIVATEFPGVRLVRLRRNLHYARGVNRAAAEARGEYLFVVNDDTEIDPMCVEILRKRLDADPEAAAAVPVMRFLDLRRFVNGVGNHVKSRSWGSDNFIGAVDLGTFDALGEVPSACFGAVLVRRSDFEVTGGLDGGYTAYYEDADWSFRVRLRGRRIVPCGTALVYHKFGGSGMPGPFKLRLVVRNRLRLVLKLFRKKMRSEHLANYIREDARSFLSLAARRDWREALAYPRAYVSLLLSMPGILWKRAVVMRTRDRSLDDVFRPAPENEYPVLTDDDGNPRLDAGVYYRHYITECARARNQATGRRG